MNSRAFRHKMYTHTEESRARTHTICCCYMANKNWKMCEWVYFNAVCLIREFISLQPFLFCQFLYCFCCCCCCCYVFFVCVISSVVWATLVALCLSFCHVCNAGCTWVSVFHMRFVSKSKPIRIALVGLARFYCNRQLRARFQAAMDFECNGAHPPIFTHTHTHPQRTNKQKSHANRSKRTKHYEAKDTHGRYSQRLQ